MVTRVSIKSIAAWDVSAANWATAIVPSTVATQFDAPVAEALYNLLPSSVSYHKSPTVIAVGVPSCLNVLVNPWSSGFEIVSPFGVTFPTSISPAFTSAPT